MNFSVMELSVLIHDLKQQRPIRRVIRREPVWNEDERPFPAFKFGNELDQFGRRNNKWRTGNLDIKSPKRFYSFWHAVSGKLSARRTPDGHSRTGWRPWLCGV
jgi:hypothetical protein